MIFKFNFIREPTVPLTPPLITKKINNNNMVRSNSCRFVQSLATFADIVCPFY